MDVDYDAIAQQYDITFKNLPYRTYIEQWSILEALGSVEGLSVLELASGTGHYARVARHRGASRVVGVDLSPEMIAVARSVEEKSPLGIDFHVHDVASLDLGETFDRVLAVYLLHYAPDREQLERMARVIAAHLKPGGRFITYQLSPDFSHEPGYYETYGLRLNLPEGSEKGLPDGQSFSFNALIGDAWSPPLTVQYWSRAALTGALEKAGLTDIQWTRPSLSPNAGERDGYWNKYIDIPHCLVLTANKPA